MQDTQVSRTEKMANAIPKLKSKVMKISTMLRLLQYQKQSKSWDFESFSVSSLHRVHGSHLPLIIHTLKFDERLLNFVLSKLQILK
jgi:hypothetical protein